MSEYHKTRLNKLCRTCGNVIKFYSHYRTARVAADYKSEILHLFSYDTDCDVVDVHPPYVCELCKKKLDRCKELTCKVKKWSEPLPSFSIHSDENCQTCKVQHKKNKGFQVIAVVQETVLVPSASSVSDLPVQPDSVASVAKAHGFIDYSNASWQNCIFGRMKMVNGYPYVDLLVSIAEDGIWQVTVFGRLVDSSVGPFKALPAKIVLENATDFFSVFESCCLCIGNNDFPKLLEKRKSMGTDLEFRRKDGTVKAFVENEVFYRAKDCTNIRTALCELVVSSTASRCSQCQEHRTSLNVSQWRLENKPEQPSKHTPNVFLSRSDLVEKSDRLQRDVTMLRRSKISLEKYIMESMQQESVCVDRDTGALCDAVFGSSDNPFPAESPQHLLWQQQAKQAKLKDARSMRWHPLLVRWCIAIYLKSPGTYEFLRSTNFLKLPHRTQLEKYTNFTEPTSGFNPDVVSNLVFEVKPSSLQPFERNVSLAFDEMKIKSGLVFSKSSGKLVGFSDLGDINKELEDFQIRAEQQEPHKSIATHVLTFMVRGLLAKFYYPVAYFPCQGFTSDQLLPCVWECVRILETVGFEVRSLVCDGASPNRRFFNLHQLPDGVNVSVDGVVYWAWNRFTPFPTRRKIYFICDVPHLMKTTRNNFENSHCHNMTRNLILEGQEVSWQHIIAIMKMDLGPNRAAIGLHLTRLTPEHVFLNPRSRMNVMKAVQVLSRSVVCLLEYQNKHYTVSTRKFCGMFNDFFDCLNVSKMSEGQAKRNRYLEPYRTADDWRLTWLKDTFLKFINDWHASCMAVLDLNKDERSRLCLSLQTLRGLRITVHSFVELVPVLLEAEGAQYFLSDKLNQDVLEEHFGRQRMRGGGNENPSLLEYGRNERKLQIGQSSLIRVFGNTSGRGGDTPLDVDDTREVGGGKRRKTR